MRSDIVYVSGVGGDAYSLNDGIYVGRPSDLFSREWSYSVGYASVSSVTRKARRPMRFAVPATATCPEASPER